ncbi:MAG: flagellar FlbD family protein [Actinobacteria bacterium]|nr:flagellar FlbD family protein [Actinomycetota bacterium]MDI6829810.1 flagellar FlbD family protein [Actinomycetota bacterium]
MIEVTRFHDEPAIINAELIEMIEARPDTIITMTTGRKIIVTESVEELVQRVIEYRQAIRPIIRTNAPVLPLECPAKACPLDVIPGGGCVEESGAVRDTEGPGEPEAGEAVNGG